MYINSLPTIASLIIHEILRIIRKYWIGYKVISQRVYRGADKSLARPGRKKATATEDFEFQYPIYNHNWRNISTIYIYLCIYIYIYKKTSIKINTLTIKQNISGSRSG